MDNTLFYVIIALGISVILNLILKRFGISQIIGYILTGTIVVYAFDLKAYNNSHSLEILGEFGIVFLMFTIGLEISLAKMNTMKKEIFFNGFLQVGITAFVIYSIAHYGFAYGEKTSLIIALAFSLSSTAVVLSYLKSSKEIYKPYGQLSTGILVFQDIAVIPILILIGFMTNEGDKSVLTILGHTVMSAVFVVALLFIVGKRVMTWMLHFSASSELDELFMGSVLFIVVSASLVAHFMGFTFSLGAFVAGMIIAETKYHHKVEADIAPFKDLLLGTFFVVVGMKIDLLVLFNNFFTIIGIFLAVLVIKSILIYGLLRITSRHRRSLKTALALSQVGEFSFVIFALASMGGIIADELVQVLVLVVILSMIVTPFFISRISPFVEYLSGRKDDIADMSALSSKSDHVIVCGYGIVGKFVTKNLDELGASYIVVDNSPKHVNEAMQDGREVYLGDMSKRSILEALNIHECSSVIVTLDNAEKKRLICEAIAANTKDINLIVKIISLEERNALSDLPINVMIDGKEEVARILVERMASCNLSAH